MIQAWTPATPLSDWSIGLARESLAAQAPRRWAHVQGSIALARKISGAFGADADMLVALAALVGVGWAPQHRQTGFASLDGAWHIEALGVPHRVCALVAHYLASGIEAELRGLQDAMSRFEDEETPVRDALWYCELHVGPDGNHTTLEDRLSEIGIRYGHDPIVAQWLERSYVPLRTASANTEARLR